MHPTLALLIEAAKTAFSVTYSVPLSTCAALLGALALLVSWLLGRTPVKLSCREKT